MPPMRRKSVRTSTRQNQMSWNSVGIKAQRGPHVVVNSPFPPRPPRPLDSRFPHDSLCLLVLTPTYQQIIRTDGLKHCYCLCSKCWDKQAQRCICRYCPCPNARNPLTGIAPIFSRMSANQPNTRNPG